MSNSSRRASKSKYEEYHITGVLVSGSRFKIVTSDFYYADGINLWKGSVWGVRRDGSRKLLKRVSN